MKIINIFQFSGFTPVYLPNKPEIPRFDPGRRQSPFGPELPAETTPSWIKEQLIAANQLSGLLCSHCEEKWNFTSNTIVI